MEIRNGGGAYVGTASRPAFYDTHFADNQAEYGGATYFHEMGDPFIRDCTFAGNEASTGASLGGAVYISISSDARNTDLNFRRWGRHGCGRRLSYRPERPAQFQRGDEWGHFQRECDPQL